MARKKNKKHQEEEAGEAWLLPYSDLMTLLLAVFIVLFATSKVDQSKADEMAAAFRDSMITSGGAGIFEGDGSSPISLYPDGSDGKKQLSEGGDYDKDGTLPNETQEQEETTPQDAKNVIEQGELSNMEEVQSNLDSLFTNEGVASSVSTHIDARGLIISLDNAILFDSGSAAIKSENEDTLLQIATTINSLDNYIRIEGHTDNVPINTSTYPSNWELSAARASSVVKLFIDKCDIEPQKLLAVGYGEFKPIGDNTTEEGRSQNRRIDIIILSEKYNSLEDQILDVQKIENE